MPSFGKTSAQRTIDRANRQSAFLKTFPTPAQGQSQSRTEGVMLWEDPGHTFFEYEEHFDKGRNRSYPCAIRSAGLFTCVGCEVPVNEDITDKEERRRDIGGWAIRSLSSRYVFPLVNDKGYIDLYKIGFRFWELLSAKWVTIGSLTATHGVFTRIGTDFNNTQYDWTPLGTPTSDMDIVNKFRALYDQVAPGYSQEPTTEAYQAAAAQWWDGSIALGVPNIGDILQAQYDEQVPFYGSSVEEQAQINAAGGRPGTREAAGVQQNLMAAARAQGAPSPTERYVPPAPAYDAPAHVQIQELCTILTRWGVPYPPSIDQAGLQSLYEMFLPMHPEDNPGLQEQAQPSPPPQPTEEEQLRAQLAGLNVPVPAGAGLDQLRQLIGIFGVGAPAQAAPVAQAVAQAAVEAPVASAAPQAEAQAEAQPAAPAGPSGKRHPAGFEGEALTSDGDPDFNEWGTQRVRDWLAADPPVEVPAMAPRSVLLETAKRAYFSF